MSKLLSLLSRKFALMVSLPRNEARLAEAAVKAGAQCLKVHINCHHFASGTTFKAWKDERKAILEVLGAVDVPVGIVTGEETQPDAEDLADIQSQRFDFWDLFAKFTPPGHLKLSMGRMVAVDSGWTPDLMKALEQIGIHIIEGSVIPKTEYRTPLNLVDLATYLRLTQASNMPVLIPTQKAVKPHEVGALQKVGAAGLTIGAVVTGLDEDSLRLATRGFAQHIEDLPPNQ
ncbi:MAG: hypothetical protein U0931_38060 [Vulcanimicrobiota bacterium]